LTESTTLKSLKNKKNERKICPYNGYAFYFNSHWRPPKFSTALATVYPQFEVSGYATAACTRHKNADKHHPPSAIVSTTFASKSL